MESRAKRTGILYSRVKEQFDQQTIGSGVPNTINFKLDRKYQQTFKIIKLAQSVRKAINVR